MNIIRRELKANLKSTIFWIAGIIFLITVWMIEFGALSNDPKINDLLDSMPDAMMNALGMGSMTLSSVGGFISSIYTYIFLILGIHAVLLGSTILSKEERDRTAEYLFTRPVSRRQVIGSKLVASFINIVILNVITSITILANSSNYAKDNNFYKFIALLGLSTFIFQMVFLSIGMLVSSISKKSKQSGSISLSILVITFLISSLVNMVDKVGYLKYITPFKYFEASKILDNLKLEPEFLILSLAIIVVGIAGTFIFYPSRDLSI